MMMSRRTYGWVGGVVLLSLLSVAQAPGQVGRAAPAVIVVRLPEDDAKLTIGGEATKQTGKVRRFTSPPLQPGKEYYYTLVAVWEPNNYETFTRKRKVLVRAGRRTEVDLRKPNPARRDSIVIRYVPTPPEVVDKMLELAKVGKDDVVYDLGCGDGRIVVAAVSKFKAKHGVGVDLDPKRLEESRANAKKAGVADKLEFRKGDVTKVPDLAKATVVTLYLSDDLNLLLRPILQKALRPGTRIVSHRFIMGDWKPDRTETMTGEDGDEYKVHLWTIKGK
jgi:uncharacterized protein (TIGR03000 family)